MFCTSCGTQLSDDTRFCGQCGKQVDSSTRRNTAAGPSRGDRGVSAVDGKAVVWIPPGHFLMGSPAEEAEEVEETQHLQKIATGFWLDVTPVTNAEYAKFIQANPAWRKGKANEQLVGSNHHYLSQWHGDSPTARILEEPVVCVSWHAARAYCKWSGKRLPTEAEWEYAARAGTTTAYWWGDRFDEARAVNAGFTEPVPLTARVKPRGLTDLLGKAWEWTASRHEGHPTETVHLAARVNPWGLADILGNVFEWTASKKAGYPYNPGDGREDTFGDDVRVVRGGAGNFDPVYLRSAFRASGAPRDCIAHVGFRCAQ